MRCTCAGLLHKQLFICLPCPTRGRCRGITRAVCFYAKQNIRVTHLGRYDIMPDLSDSAKTNQLYANDGYLKHITLWSHDSRMPIGITRQPVGFALSDNGPCKCDIWDVQRRAYFTALETPVELQSGREYRITVPLCWKHGGKPGIFLDFWVYFRIFCIILRFLALFLGF